MRARINEGLGPSDLEEPHAERLGNRDRSVECQAPCFGIYPVHGCRVRLEVPANEPRARGVDGIVSRHLDAIRHPLHERQLSRRGIESADDDAVVRCV